jgi:hypothetical protein
MRLSTSAGAVAAAIALTGGLMAPAQAERPFEQGHYEDTFSESFEECGLNVHVEAEFGGSFVTKVVKGSDGQAFLAQDNYWYRQVWTNEDNGDFLVIRGNGMFKEMTATHVVGDIWEFTAKDVGMPFVIEDSDGNVVLRDRGQIRFRALFDTLGDGQPGGEPIEEELLGFSGKFPGVDADFCAILTDLIG